MARILVVDDDPDLRELAVMALQREGHAVTAAADAPAALAVLSYDAGFDALVLDVAMPTMTGVELLRRVRRDLDLHEVMVIMVTATTGDAAVESAFVAGADEYLTKPYSMRELARRVSALLARRAAHIDVR